MWHEIKIKKKLDFLKDLEKKSKLNKKNMS